MANWNLSKRLFMGVGSLVALLLVSGGVSFFTGRSMKAQLDGATKQTARQQELALMLQRDGVSLSNLQREYIAHITRQVLRPVLGMPADARAIARADAKSLRREMAAAMGRPGYSAEARAHLAESIETLDEALKAPLVRGTL